MEQLFLNELAVIFHQVARLTHKEPTRLSYTGFSSRYTRVHTRVHTRTHRNCANSVERRKKVQTMKEILMDSERQGWKNKDRDKERNNHQDIGSVMDSDCRVCALEHFNHLNLNELNRPIKRSWFIDWLSLGIYNENKHEELNSLSSWFAYDVCGSVCVRVCDERENWFEINV